MPFVDNPKTEKKKKKKKEKKFQMKDNFRGDENDLALPDSRRRSL